MEKYEIIVPKGIRYVGELDEMGERIWKDYDLGQYSFPHILNKKLTGCGYTEYCIKNNQDLILISPRKFLLENKLEQHPGEVYYVQNDLETSVDYELDMNDDLKRIRKKAEKVEAGKHDTISNLDVLKNNLRDAVKEMKLRGNPVKILVTYDSFRHVRDALEQFYIDGEGITPDYKVEQKENKDNQYEKAISLLK